MAKITGLIFILLLMILLATNTYARIMEQNCLEYSSHNNERYRRQSGMLIYLS